MYKKRPVAVCMSDLPQKKDINDIQELNKVLNFLGIHSHLDSTDSNSVILDKIEEICNSQSDIFTSLQSEVRRIKEREKTLEANLNVEKECDMLEITLASLKDKYAEYKKLYSHSVEELEKELATLNNNFNDVQFETINMEILSKVYEFIKGDEVDGDLINSLSYVTHMDGFKNLVEKYEILSEVEEYDSSRLFAMLVRTDVVRVDDLCSSLGGDRINTLELLYYLQSIDVITFDNLNGTVRLKK